MKKLITILGAGLLAFGMFTSCGAKDVNLSWSDESTTYTYTCDVTAGTVADIDEPSSYTIEQARKTATSTTTNAYTLKYATVSWSDGYAGNNATKDEGNTTTYTIMVYYDVETTTTVNATGNVTYKNYLRDQYKTLSIKKIDDKYYLNYGTKDQTEVTVDGDIEDDEFTFSVDAVTVTFYDDWKADGSTNYFQGTTTYAIQRPVRSGYSLSNVTLERK